MVAGPEACCSKCSTNLPRGPGWSGEWVILKSLSFQSGTGKQRKRKTTPHPHPLQGTASQQPTLYQGERRELAQGKLYAKGNCSFGENGYLFYLSWCLKSSESNLVSVSLHRTLKRMPPLWLLVQPVWSGSLAGKQNLTSWITGSQVEEEDGSKCGNNNSSKRNDVKTISIEGNRVCYPQRAKPRHSTAVAILFQVPCRLAPDGRKQNQALTKPSARSTPQDNFL